MSTWTRRPFAQAALSRTCKLVTPSGAPSLIRLQPTVSMFAQAHCAPEYVNVATTFLLYCQAISFPPNPFVVSPAFDSDEVHRVEQAAVGFDVHLATVRGGLGQAREHVGHPVGGTAVDPPPAQAADVRPRPLGGVVRKDRGHGAVVVPLLAGGRATPDLDVGRDVVADA